jgi:Coenzyme PQQ synthesis protein D (PqqD)
MPVPQQVTIADSVLYQSLQGEVVLLNMETQHYFSLDDVGSRMWELLIELQKLPVVEERLLADFEVDPKVLREDLDRLVGGLMDAGLLKSVQNG